MVASRGSGPGPRRRAPVSIPFIAGQWSLRATARRSVRDSGTFQSPSLRGSGRFGRGFTSRCRRRCWFQSPSLRGSGRFFTPRMGEPDGGVVSIPFIAGQWSLQITHFPEPPCIYVSIPFIAGQWSLPVTSRSPTGGPGMTFQSPSLRGSGRFEVAEARCDVARRVSIPFIAGQWSLPIARSCVL